MTNKPMLSVEREMLERWTTGRVSLSHLAEMRALLDAQHIVCSNGILCQNSKCAECGGNGSYKPAAQHQGEPVAWTDNKPHKPGAYWIRGNGLDRDSLIEVVDDADGLRCNLHQRTTEADFGYGYSIDDLSDEFEWRGPLYAEQAAPVAVVMPEHTMRSVMEVTQEASQFYVPGTSNWCGHIANRLNGVKP